MRRDSPPAQELLTWYDQHRRDLPWRRTHDPYKIWLSEVMLQQTRVETVLPFYTRFLKRFPSVAALAAAPVDEVLSCWSGLGYYRRARQLHSAARRIDEIGTFPSTLEGLLSLPGIGAYTAAAVASIAFGVAEPVMDGNVERVLSRWLRLDEDPRSGPARRKLLAAAKDLLDPGRPGDSNQAMMELGATLCSPRRPKCLLCPLRPGCQATLSGDPESFPIPRARRRGERHRLLVAVVEDLRGRGILLYRRPEDSFLLAGTWELPWVTLAVDGVPQTESPEAALALRYGGDWTLGEKAGQVRHGITFRDLEVDVYRARREGEDDPGVTSGWFDGEGRAGLALSSLVGKVLGSLGAATAEAAPARKSRSRRR